MNVFDFLSKRLGIDTIDSSFYLAIETWLSWYKANVERFHRYKVYNGHRDIKCQRQSLHMASQLSKDMANLLVNERVKISIAHPATDEFVHKVLSSNQWQFKANEYQEWKSALGTAAYVCQITDVETDAEGNVMPLTGRIKIDYVRAYNIFPITWSNGIIHETVFRFRKVVRGKVYYHLQIHKLENNEYIIENHVVRDTQSTGTEIDPSMWDTLPPFKGMSPVIHTGSNVPLFAIDKLNIANPYGDDDEIPLGVSIFYDCIDTLREIDSKYDSFYNEFSLGRKRIFVAPEFLEDSNGNAVFDEDDAVFYMLPEDSLPANDAIHEVNMELRVQEHIDAINCDLNLLSMKCGFGQNHYKFNNGSIQTATQVVSENSDMFRTVQKHELKLDAVIKELCKIIATIGVNLGYALDPESEIEIDFDDSIIEDKEAERASDRSDVAMGAMPLYEYRMKWYGETEEEAKKKVVEDDGVME